MKKLLIVSAAAMLTFGAYAGGEGKGYSLEQLHKIIESGKYPAITEYEETGGGDVADIKSCKDRILSRAANFSEYPITVERDIENEAYESTVWMNLKAQKVICEVKDGKAKGTQFDAPYK
ncbi:hypothetical protein [Morganella psychrotolerans]|uniref:Uncharacterized protein n=1 Tax=Morganella psychrotolerans TaxID=368603 RepID=A0A1B8H6P4_9GAMM|nr:hypothetical protein [Morganella psychrotolerans]OBU04737.1 hypothetical protein AYY17_07465 [Morganella psychrotolerans]